MKTQLGVIILCMAILAGCDKKEDTTASHQDHDHDVHAAPAVDTTETPSVSIQTAEASVVRDPVAASPAVPTQLGDAAYPLTPLTWIKGEPTTIAAGKVYVVEFWATWCPPCRESIPHLTQLQKQYKDRGVVFVGISNEEAATVEPFVASMGDRMDYSVAVDSTGAVTNGYMIALGQGSIPTAFVVNAQGRVVWHGHPMDNLDKVLDLVLGDRSKSEREAS